MVKQKAKSIGVPVSEAEPIRTYLREQRLLREDVQIRKEGMWIYFPVLQVPENLAHYKVVTKAFESRTKKPRCYKEILKLSKKLRGALPTSYDVVGDIILIKLPKVLLPYKKEIGKALLDTHTNIRTVCLIDAVSGELRTRNITVIAGEKKTLTTHREFGLSFQVDVSTTYFSPRLASERKRVATLVKPGEVVVDLFAGIAPFSIMIARYGKPKIVYAIDKNKDAIRLAQQNVKQNHVLETVEVIHTDANDARQLIPKKADRIIMNLPFSAFQFFMVALSIAAPTCKVHYYDIVRQEDIDVRVDELRKIATKQGYRLTSVSIRKIKSYAPREFYIGVDITATKTPT